MTTDPFTEAARTEAERVRRDGKYLTPAGRGPLLSSATTMIELREALAVAETLLLAVRELHTPREEQVVTGDCSIEECDHEDECPTVSFLVCTECWRMADEADTYFAERGVGHVAHPCPTIQALDSASAARRDDEAPTAPAISLKQRIRDLHTADDETGDCIYCTRGRIYPVPAPCATVRLLEDEATR